MFIFGYASPFRPLQGGLSTSHDACWSQTRQGDDLSPRGFVCPVFCVHLLRSFCEPCGSVRFLRGCDEAVCLQARCVFQASSLYHIRRYLASENSGFFVQNPVFFAFLPIKYFAEYGKIAFPRHLTRNDICLSIFPRSVHAKSRPEGRLLFIFSRGFPRPFRPSAGGRTSRFR